MNSRIRIKMMWVFKVHCPCRLTLSMLGKKNPADAILKQVSYFSQKIGFDISWKLSPICMKYQSLFSEKNETSIINLSSAEFAQIVVKVQLMVMSLQPVQMYSFSSISNIGFTFCLLLWQRTLSTVESFVM